MGDWGLSGVTASTENPIYLSLSAPRWANSTTLWYNSGGGWTQLTAGLVPTAPGLPGYDLTFNGTYYSFSLTGMKGGWADFGDGYGDWGTGWNNLDFDGFDYAVVSSPLAGDCVLEGKVDINDLTVVLSNYGKTGRTWTQGSMDGDPTGTVDINDLTIVLSNYGAAVAAPRGVGLTAVPEPGALALLTAGLLGLPACAWRKRR
jgi:hypothetical protein